MCRWTRSSDTNINIQSERFSPENVESSTGCMRQAQRRREEKKEEEILTWQERVYRARLPWKIMVTVRLDLVRFYNHSDGWGEVLIFSPCGFLGAWCWKCFQMVFQNETSHLPQHWEHHLWLATPLSSQEKTPCCHGDVKVILPGKDRNPVTRWDHTAGWSRLLWSDALAEVWSLPPWTRPLWHHQSIKHRHTQLLSGTSHPLHPPDSNLFGCSAVIWPSLDCLSSNAPCCRQHQSAELTWGGKPHLWGPLQVQHETVTVNRLSVLTHESCDKCVPCIGEGRMMSLRCCWTPQGAGGGYII